MTSSAQIASSAIALAREAASADHSALVQQLRDKPVVIAGAGGLGRKVLAGLRQVRIEPIAFADNNAGLWGTRLETLDILNPEDAARRFGADAIFVMATWRPVKSNGLGSLNRQLQQMGCRTVIPFPKIFWALPEAFSAHYLWDRPARIESQWDAVERAYALFTGQSRDEFAAHLVFRATASLDALPSIQNHPQYFPDFLKPFTEEHFIDCGAYNGDTISAFLNWTQGRFRTITAFEADPACHRQLERFASAHPEIGGRLVCHAKAVTARAGFVRFNASGNSSSGIAESGTVEVPAATLDDVLKDEAPTFIKMDIEGAELDALRGAAKTIRRQQPVLAICVYHAQDHLWRIPLLIHELFPGARYFLKSYCLDGLETVCYAVPAHRLQKGIDQ